MLAHVLRCNSFVDNEKLFLCLEQVKRRATCLTPEERNLPYHIGLKCLELTTLEIRRIRGDMLQLRNFSLKAFLCCLVVS